MHLAGAGRWMDAKEWKREPRRQAHRLAKGAPGIAGKNVVDEDEGRPTQSQDGEARDGFQVDQLVPARGAVDWDQPAGDALGP